MKLVIMIPAYNEEKTIAAVIEEIPRKVDGINSMEVLVIDDGSTDGTIEQAMKAGIDRVVSHKVNQGLGNAFRDGLNAALEMGADIIVNIDADGQYNAKEIPKLIKPILETKADIVLGWRDIYNLDFMPMGKKVGNKLSTWVTKRLSGLPIKDAQTGFRAFSKEAALRLNPSANFTYVHETIIQASCKNLRIEQIPVEFKSREGKSRLISGLASYAFRGGITLLRTYRDYKTSKAYLSISGLLFVVGLVFTIIVLVQLFAIRMMIPYLFFAVVALGLLVFGLQAMLFGFYVSMYKSQRQKIEEILYLLKKNDTRGKNR